MSAFDLFSFLLFLVFIAHTMNSVFQIGLFFSPITLLGSILGLLASQL